MAIDERVRRQEIERVRTLEPFYDEFFDREFGMLRDIYQSQLKPINDRINIAFKHMKYERRSKEAYMFYVDTYKQLLSEIWSRLK